MGVADRPSGWPLRPDLYQHAWDYATAVDHVLWEDLGEYDRAGDHLREPQARFLNAAHEKLG